jgi:uncharacterized sulfatase
MLRHLALILGALAVGQAAAEADEAPATERPNILWISLEDLSPDLGCYGDRYARTPVFDEFARQGVRFTKAYTHAPVCAPSRSGIITAMYPTSIGTHHMRCQAVLPPEVKCFTEYLRAAGYYCTNNAKTDYQFNPPAATWDQNNNRGHWRTRAAGQPFFAVFNINTTHESQIRSPNAQRAGLADEERHDPAKGNIPQYYPDTPIVRRDWATYHDNITAAEKQVARLLDQLKKDGLAEDTVVWIWGDHGRGLPRGKRWIYDSGTHIPLLIRVPEKWRGLVSPQAPEKVAAGSVIEDLIAVIDFGPTVLSLTGVEVPQHMQGGAFLGPKRGEARKYLFAGRDRMDERYDLIRSVHDGRFHYIRNFMPHVPYAQHIGYMDEMPTMKEMRRLHSAGKLEGPPALFFRDTKPVDELYDTEADPHEVRNLADDRQHAEKLAELRGELVKWMHETRDLGWIPEPMLDEAQRPGRAGRAKASRRGEDWRPSVWSRELLDRWLKLKEHDRQPQRGVAAYETALDDMNPAIRYWALVGMSVGLNNGASKDQINRIARMMENDPAPVNRITAARVLCQWGEQGRGVPVLLAALGGGQPSLRLNAALALDELPPSTLRKHLPALQAAAAGASEYQGRVLAHVVAEIETAK